MEIVDQIERARDLWQSGEFYHVYSCGIPLCTSESIKPCIFQHNGPMMSNLNPILTQCLGWLVSTLERLSLGSTEYSEEWWGFVARTKLRYQVLVEVRNTLYFSNRDIDSYCKAFIRQLCTEERSHGPYNKPSLYACLTNTF